MSTRRQRVARRARSASKQIDARIRALGDWRGVTLSRLRTLIRKADPGVVEQWKWRGVPVWSHDGVICTGETYKHVVKLTFLRGASVQDPSGLFNASLEGNARRAIDFHQGDEVDEEAFEALIRAAVALNTMSHRTPEGSSQLLRFPRSARRDPAIDVWMRERSGALGTIARRWFEVMRHCGDDVRELLHDGHPTACVGDAAFGYVNAFSAHVNVGFFRGAELTDPGRLLEGTGKVMRHVKLRPGSDVDVTALTKLIETSYRDMKSRLKAE